MFFATLERAVVGMFGFDKLALPVELEACHLPGVVTSIGEKTVHVPLHLILTPESVDNATLPSDHPTLPLFLILTELAFVETAIGHQKCAIAVARSATNQAVIDPIIEVLVLNFDVRI
jgi:hypothetical protein